MIPDTVITTETSKTVATTDPTVATSPVIVATNTTVATTTTSLPLTIDTVKHSLAYYITLGMRGLLGSKKGSFAIIILIVTTVALFMAKITGESYVAALTVISGIYSISTSAVDIRNGGNR